MPSPFYGTDAVYGMRALLGTSNGLDIDAGFAALRDDVAAKMKGAVPRVTTLPTVGPSGSGSLVDGQECYLVADATNGVVWHLRYNLGSASAYKWEYVGGAALSSQVDANETVASASYADIATVGPSITLPAGFTGGDFDVAIGAFLSNNAGVTKMSYAIGGVAASDNDSIEIFGGTSVIVGAHVHRARRKTALAASTALVSKYKLFSGGSGVAAARYMTVLPIRVG